MESDAHQLSDLVDGTTIYSDDLDSYAGPVNLLEDGTAFWGVDTGPTANAYEVTLTPAPNNPLNPGAVVHFRAGKANTGSSTLKLNGLSPIVIKKNVTQDLEAGDIVLDQVISVATTEQPSRLVGGAGGALELDDLADVTLTTPSNLQILQRNASGQFVNRSLEDANIASKSALDTHLADMGNPHSVTAAQVGAAPDQGWRG